MKSLFRFAAIAFSLLLFLVIGWKAYTKSQENALYEAAIRYATQDTPVEGYKLFFLRINMQDPSPDFLKRFQGAPFTIRAGSQCIGKVSPFSGHRVKDKTTGEEGIELKFGHISWFGQSSPTVRAGADLYVMKRDGDSWKVDYHGIIGG